MSESSLWPLCGDRGGRDQLNMEMVKSCCSLWGEVMRPWTEVVTVTKWKRELLEAARKKNV